MLIALLLFLTCVRCRDAVVVTLRQGVECLDLAVLVEPVLLPDRRILLRGGKHGAGLFDRLIESSQKPLIVAPAFWTKTGARRGEKLRLILFAILNEQCQSLAGLLLAGDEFAQLARCFVETDVGKVEQGLQIEGAIHASSIVPELLKAAGKQTRQPGQAAFRVGMFFDPLLKEGFQLRIDGNGAIQQRIRARRVGANGQQIPGALIT